MFKAKEKEREELAGEIKRMSGRAENQSFLRAMPLFGVDTTMPESFRQLLLKMDKVAGTQPALRK